MKLFQYFRKSTDIIGTSTDHISVTKVISSTNKEVKKFGDISA